MEMNTIDKNPAEECVHLVTLAALGAGDKCFVKAVSSANKKLCSKLLAMGIVAGTLVEVICYAPLGDPIKIRARGYELSLRISEAHEVQVIPL